MTALPHPSSGAVAAYVRWALKLSDLPTTARGVALEVASHYSYRDGYSHPSWAEIGAVLGLTRGNVWRAVRAVTEAGIWTVETTAGKGSRYRFPLAGVIHTGRADATGVDGAPVAVPRPPRRGTATGPVAVPRPEQEQEQDKEQLAPTGTADAAGVVPGWAAARWPSLRVHAEPTPPGATWEDYG